MAKKNKSWFIVWLVFCLSLILPWGWRFWLSNWHLNYLSLTFSLADAWIGGFFIVFLVWVFLNQKKKKVKVLVFFGLSALIFILLVRPGLVINWQAFRLWQYLRIIVLTLIGLKISSKIEKKYFQLNFFWILIAISLLSLIEFLLANFYFHGGSFHFFAGQDWFLSHLFYPHPNILAFAGLVCFWGAGAEIKKLGRGWLAWPAILILVTLTGSVTGALILGIWSLIFKKRFLIFSFVSLILASLATNWQTAGFHLSWLRGASWPNKWLIPAWPTINLSNQSLGHHYWLSQPIHNTFLLIGLGLGWDWLILTLILLAYVFSRTSIRGKLILFLACFWFLTDHFFITLTSGQNLTALLIIILLSWKSGLENKTIPLN